MNSTNNTSINYYLLLTPCTHTSTRHIPQNNGYKLGRSVLTSDPKMLLKGLHTQKYKIIRIINEHKVTVEFAEEIGYYYVEGKLPQITKYGTIHYGKKAAHIVPANPIRKIL